MRGAINPEIEIIARAHSDAEVDHLRSNGAGFIIMGEREVARGMLAHVLTDTPEPSSDLTPDGIDPSLFDRPDGAIVEAQHDPEPEAADAGDSSQPATTPPASEAEAGAPRPVQG